MDKLSNNNSIDTEQKTENRPIMCSIDKIDCKYSENRINENARMLFYIYSIFDKKELTRDYTSELPIKSGTTIVKQIQDYIQHRSSDEKIVQIAKRYTSSAIPNLDQEYISPTGYFKIHYTTKGTNAVSKTDTTGNGTPDYIELVASAFDHVKKITCSDRGFRKPMLDENKKTFDVNIYDLQGVYGITFANSYYKTLNTNRRIASSKISIDNDYSPSKGFKDSRDNCMKVTAAHEFFHAVQYAYNSNADLWWMEASATWNEDEIYDSVNDYIRYLNKVFSEPNKSLEKSNYGGVVFTKYLSENLGGYNIIKRIWEHHGTSDNKSLSAIDKAITEKYRNESLESVFNKYAAYNIDPTQYYKEGYLWKDRVFLQNTFDNYPISTKSNNLEHLSSDYHLFKATDKNEKSLIIDIDGQNKANWGFKIQCKKHTDRKYEISEIVTDGFNNKTQIICKNFGSKYSEVCLIPSNLERTTDNVSYSFSAKIQ